MTDISQDHIYEEKESTMSKSSQLILQITGAGLFGAISLIISGLTTGILPRVPGWGIAIIDPVSIIWMICFLVFGARSGLLCCGIGTLGLMIFDRSFPIVGPLMKLSATLPLILVYILFLKLYKTEEGIRNSQKMRNPRNYIVYGMLGILARIGVMLLANYLLFITLLADALPFVSLDFIGLPSVSGWSAIVFGVIIINAETSIWDLLFPYLIVFTITRSDKWFSIW